MTNTAVLIGRLTKEPELRYTPSNHAVTTFTLAVPRDFKTSNGERESDFIQCVVWNKSAENIMSFVTKGSLLSVTGRIQTRNYENQQGQRVYVSEVVVEKFQTLESREVNEKRKTNRPELPQQNNGLPDDKQRDFGNIGADNWAKNVEAPPLSDSDLPF